jgi:DNA helicase II / ATP-dependent DNA helicase PcrA
LAQSSVAPSRITSFQPNRAQAEAIYHVHGSMLVLAGAGTGKTSVLVHRIVNLISQGHARPDEIMAVTFTNKAAGEIRERVAEQLGGKQARKVRTCTFHAYCNELLKASGLEFGLLTREDLWVYLRQRIKHLPLDYFVKASDPGRFLDDLLTFFDRCNDELVDASRYSRYVEQVVEGSLPLPRVYKSKDADEIAPEEIIAKCREIAQVYSAVERMLQADALLTFGSLITETIKRFCRDEKLLEKERRKGRFLLVDEFQDSNHAQIELARLLTGEDGNAFAVGDPDQAIYHFRGASSGAFQRFLECFPNSKVVNLAENQRSTPAILECAYAAIRQNPEVVSSEPHLFQELKRELLQSARAAYAASAGRPFTSLPVEIVPYSSYGQEAADVADSILALRKGSRAAWSNFAVLYRSHLAARQLISELGARGIPFVVTGVDLFNTSVLRDLVSVLHCLYSFEEHVSLFRLATRPQFGIAARELQARLAAARRGTTMAAVLSEMKAGKELMDRLIELRKTTNTESAEIRDVVDRAVEFLRLDRKSNALQRFYEFVSDWRAKKFVQHGILPEFLEYMNLWRVAGGCLDANPAVRAELNFEEARSANAVQLMTIHSAKGLEFTHVFVLRVASGSFPANYRERLFEFPRELREGFARVEADDKTLQEQEERRLFYVAITRARDTLALYGKPVGRHPIPSKFLRELTEVKEITGQVTVRGARPVQLEIGIDEEIAPWLAMSASAHSLSKLSASAIEQYDRCPLQFKLARIWNLPAELPAAVQYGAAIHTALKDYYDALIQGRPRSEEQLLALFRTKFEEYSIPEELQRDLYLEQGLEQLREFHKESAAQAAPKVLGTEVPFEIKIAGVTVIGRLDRLDELSPDTVSIVDYKTGNPKSQDDADKSVQLSIYAMAAWKQFKKFPERLVFHNLENNSLVTSSRSERMLAGIEEKIGKVAEGIEIERFVANPGYHCRWCSYRDVCPATEERMGNNLVKVTS